MTEITRYETGARMSQAVRANGMVWLAGQVGHPGESVAEQTRTCLAEVDRLLALAGSDKTRIVSAQIWLADMADFAEMNAVWDEWVPQGHCPARATGEAKLAAPGYRVEVIVTAVI
ncbi:RidA family protein [Cereibacter azotoformans]|uniref:Enamine deaminase RidA (YjgF/YER057c/UK114 family) n=2 Tax=Cereibacter TaxID=1653176 RepID=A0A2T5KDN3_9RHOB|nr:RidA family protein [Cereibacter azotoformans]AXQ93729.1 RidA family protein [Cereibacter sphaeroides]MBO4168477.1 RidA family protein [Cereibacter azotoformans]PTR20535.1 enamine deaminase RidA (YjgF/YER057c/UK114 family) [Cereibacter azotoformans]UIJ29236.1 RidA family protein [Cereibacter azotoformans]ULB09923.1 RidA family protein [Cereibacter azotoformans]